MSKLQVDTIVNLDDSGAPSLRYGAEVPVGYGITGAGGINITGVCTATSFSGSGSGLTGVASTDNIITGTAATFNNKVNINSTLTCSEGINVSAGVITAPSASFSGNVTIGGTITYEDVTNVDSVGVVTARTGVVVTAGGVRVVSGGATIIGIVTATSFEGDISGATGAWDVYDGWLYN